MNFEPITITSCALCLQENIWIVWLNSWGKKRGYRHSRCKSAAQKNKARRVIKFCSRWIFAKFCSGSSPGGHSWWRWTLASNLWHWSGCLATFKGQDTTAGWQFWDFLKVSSLLFWFWWREIQKIRQRSRTLWTKSLVLHGFCDFFERQI